MKKIKMWISKTIKYDFQNFANWLNCWGDFDKHKEKTLDNLYTIGKEKKPNHITKYGEGYNQAISDVYDKLKMEYK